MSPTRATDLVALLRDQDGVVSRKQAEAAGLLPHDLARLLRRREWAPIGPGLYVDHTGRPTWSQHAWAAVLRHRPAALHGISALRAAGWTAAGDTDTVHVAIDRARGRPRQRPGVVIHQVARLQRQVSWSTSPPRQRFEHAVLDVAAGRDDAGALALLAAACSGRRTTAERMAAALAERSRMPRRAWVEEVLVDIGAGTHSVLERGYLRLVERAHGLPASRRQARAQNGGRTRYRDVTYPGGAVIELDGFAFHGDAAQREVDLARDLEHAAEGGVTVRLGYRQVFDTPCATTAAVTRFLWSRGLTFLPTPCGQGCAVPGLVGTGPLQQV